MQVLTLTADKTNFPCSFPNLGQVVVGLQNNKKNPTADSLTFYNIDVEMMF